MNDIRIMSQNLLGSDIEYPTHAKNPKFADRIKVDLEITIFVMVIYYDIPCCNIIKINVLVARILRSKNTFYSITVSAINIIINNKSLRIWHVRYACSITTIN